MKRLPIFTPSQRRGLLVIECVLIVGVLGYSLWTWHSPKSTKEGIEKSSGRSGHPGKQYIYAVDEVPFESFPFDPNTADSTTLLRLGLSPWQVRSIYRYRAKHGRYHKPEDFMRVPGMTNEQWERLRPYVRIAKAFQYVEPEARKSFAEEAPREQTIAEVKQTRQDSFPKQEKIHFGQTIDINTADTSLLKMIPGIASRRAARIVAYRKTLGGFTSVEQAMEAIEMPDSVLKYMSVSPVEIKRINVNELSVQQLMKHPYLNFYQAKAIFEHRRNKGDLHSLDELSRLEGFRQTDLDRLRPYITFE